LGLGTKIAIFLCESIFYNLYLIKLNIARALTIDGIIREHMNQVNLLYLYETYGDKLFLSVKQPFINAATTISPESLEVTKQALDSAKTGQTPETVAYARANTLHYIWLFFLWTTNYY
jgi:hypothetical protein